MRKKWNWFCLDFPGEYLHRDSFSFFWTQGSLSNFNHTLLTNVHFQYVRFYTQGHDNVLQLSSNMFLFFSSSSSSNPLIPNYWLLTSTHCSTSMLQWNIPILLEVGSRSLETFFLSILSLSLSLYFCSPSDFWYEGEGWQKKNEEHIHNANADACDIIVVLVRLTVISAHRRLQLVTTFFLLLFFVAENEKKFSRPSWSRIKREEGRKKEQQEEDDEDDDKEETESCSNIISEIVNCRFLHSYSIRRSISYHWKILDELMRGKTFSHHSF